MPRLKRAAFALSVVIITVSTFSYIARPESLNTFTNFTKSFLFKAPHMTSTASWSSPLSGFLNRAEPYRRPSTDFQPPRSSLKLAVLRNAPAEQQGFTLAIFSQSDSDGDDTRHYAVNKYGAIHILQAEDVETLQGLVGAVGTLPSTEAYRNAWVLKHERTSQPIDRILVPKYTLSPHPEDRYDQEYSETSVQGFDYQKRELRRPVEGIETLPQDLWELVGAVLEARDVTEGGREDSDDVVLSYVRNLLGNVY